MKVLALIAWVNCKQPLSGKIVTQEEKEKLLEERNKNQASSPVGEIMEASLTESGGPEVETELKDYGTLPNKEENDQTADNDLVFMISSDNESDQELLMDEHTQRRTSFLTEKVINYYHWCLILFKNGWWRTTLLLWYLWYVSFYSTYVPKCSTV